MKKQLFGLSQHRKAARRLVFSIRYHAIILITIDLLLYLACSILLKLTKEKNIGDTEHRELNISQEGIPMTYKPALE